MEAPATQEYIGANAHGATAVSCAVAATAISFICVLGRLVTRFAIVKSPGYEDGLITLAWLFSLLFTICVIFQVHYGMGRHVATLTGNDIMHFFQFFWISIWTYNVSLTLTKLSLLMLYKRIFSIARFERIVNIMLGIVVLYGLATFFDCVFICYPISFYWTRQGDGECIQQWPMFYANSALNIITDLMIIICPIPMLKGLQLPKRQKIALMGVFAIGGFVCLVSILRFWVLHKANQSTDWSYDNVSPAMWTTVETNVAIILATLPTLKPLIKAVFPRLMGSSKGGLSGPSGVTGATSQHNKATTERMSMSRVADEENWGEIMHKDNVVKTMEFHVTST